MQINNATGLMRQDQSWEVTAAEKERLWYSTVKKESKTTKPTLFHRQDAMQDPATQESATIVQWSSNVKQAQVSPAQDILVFFVPLGLYVLSE